MVDFGHLNARHIGSYFNVTDDYLRVFDRIENALGASYAENLHCHFSKIEYTGAGEKRHLTFEDSVFGPPFEPLVEALYRVGGNVRVLCESDGTMAEDALIMKRYFDSLKNARG